MKTSLPVLATAAAVLLTSCSAGRKIDSLRSGRVAAGIAVADDVHPVEIDFKMPRRDTLKVRDADGKEIFIMDAVQDDNGEMVATEMLAPVIVTASFKNVAERHGRVDLCFNITVPAQMQDSRWQIRLAPDLETLGETTPLESIVITGERYRQRQLRGYELYERFVSSIITDPSLFIRRRELEIFIERNIPELYELRGDMTTVSDERFASIWGVTHRDALEHYTDRLKIRHNDRRKSRLPEMYRRYVKVPITTEGLRLDTVITSSSGDITYEYVQTIAARPGLRKAGITLGGGIYEEDREVFGIPREDTITFYISSLSTLVDNTVRYVTRVVERRVEENSVCWIDFDSGSARLDPRQGHNTEEMARIGRNLRQLMENETFDMDSIVVAASASPEGGFLFNRGLSRRRSEAVCGYFQDYVAALRDSVKAEEGVRLSLDGAYVASSPIPSVRFIPRSLDENWAMLDALVDADEQLSDADKEDYRAAAMAADPDLREAELSAKPCYRYLREKLYPRLRTVKFSFYLHRKGMVKDTLVTTVPDTLYMSGVQAIRDREYEKAVSILRPYRDFNAAVACAAMDYNASALDILLELEQTAACKYVEALVYSRQDRPQEALQAFLDACAMEPSYIHRGNLDPEISELTRKYNLEKIYEDF